MGIIRLVRAIPQVGTAKGVGDLPPMGAIQPYRAVGSALL
jgi:hypothetical protein